MRVLTRSATSDKPSTIPIETASLASCQLRGTSILLVPCTKKSRSTHDRVKQDALTWHDTPPGGRVPRRFIPHAEDHFMVLDFATPVERRHPEGGEWSTQKWHRYDASILPLWVADMDFRSPPPVIEALQARVDHGVFGYGGVSARLKATLCEWSAQEYHWPIEPEWQLWLPGVVPALHLASLALTEPGEGVLTVTPIYPPFLQVAERTGRTPQQAAMAEPAAPGEPWRLDLAALEAAITPRTRLLPWCHPHNPTGRVWRHDELAGLAELVVRHDLTVVSDELHCDLLLDEGARHVPLAAAFPELASRTLTLWAPSKTFNLAGLTTACAVIPDAALRRRFAAAIKGLVPDGNVLGLVAAESAYAEGDT